MCSVAREGLGEKSMRSFLVSRLTVITLGSIYCSRRGLSRPDCEISVVVNSKADLAVKPDLKCLYEKACVGFWPVMCRLCVGNDEGGNCAGSAIFGILAKEVFL